MGKIHDLSGYSRADCLVEFTGLAKQGRRTPEPVWLARGREQGAKAPAWLRVLAEHYRPAEPIKWGPVGEVDRAKPAKSVSWADR